METLTIKSIIPIDLSKHTDDLNKNLNALNKLDMVLCRNAEHNHKNYNAIKKLIV